METEHLDLPRTRAGGMTGGLFAIYVPPDPAANDRTESMHLCDDDGPNRHLAGADGALWASTVERLR
jgi:hypothetical protein